MGPGGLVVDGFMILCTLSIWHPDPASRGFAALSTRDMGQFSNFDTSRT